MSSRQALDLGLAPSVFPPGSGVLAVLLVAVFLEPIKDAQRKREGDEGPPFWSTLLSTFRLLGDKRLRLLVLLPMYTGFEQAFLAGDYTRVRDSAARGAPVRPHLRPWVSGPPAPGPGGGRGSRGRGTPGPSRPEESCARGLGHSRLPGAGPYLRGPCVPRDVSSGGIGAPVTREPSHRTPAGCSPAPDAARSLDSKVGKDIKSTNNTWKSPSGQFSNDASQSGDGCGSRACHPVLP